MSMNSSTLSSESSSRPPNPVQVRDPQRCPICQKVFVNSPVLITHVNEKHEMTFVGTLTPDGKGLQLMPMHGPGDQGDSTPNRDVNGGAMTVDVEALERSARNLNLNPIVAATQIPSAQSPSRSSTGSGDRSGISNHSFSLDRTLPKMAGLSMRTLSPSSRNSSLLTSGQRSPTQRSPTAPRVLDPSAMEFQPMQFCLPTLTIPQEGGEVMRSPSGFTDHSLHGSSSVDSSANDLSMSTEELYGMVDGQSLVSDETPLVSPVNSVFDSPLLHQSTPHALAARSLSVSTNALSVDNPYSSHFQVEVNDRIRRDLRNSIQTHKTLTGRPCDIDGNYTNAPATYATTNQNLTKNWHPFSGRRQFEFTELSFREMEIPPDKFDKLMTVLSLPTNGNGSHAEHSSPFRNHREMLQTIDSITVSNELPWLSCTFAFNKVPGDIPLSEHAPWMDVYPEAYYRDSRLAIHTLLRNTAFANAFDIVPYEKYDSNGVRLYDNLFSGNWCWTEADKIVSLADVDDRIDGVMLVPIMLGGNGKVMSFGKTDYEPLFMSIGNLHNHVRRYRNGAILLLGFIAYPRYEREEDETFLLFKRQLRHQYISHVLDTLKPAMTKPEVIKCPDGHFRRAIYSIGPHIADYSGQVELGSVLNGFCSCCILPPWSPAFRSPKSTDQFTFRKSSGISGKLTPSARLNLRNTYGMLTEIPPYTSNFPRADICELLVPDVLSQVVKGSFFEHNLNWLKNFLVAKHGEPQAQQLLEEIDKRIALSPQFSGICRIPLSRDFKFRSGAEYLGFMKIILPCLIGFVPNKVILSFRHLLDCCYIIRRAVISEEMIITLKHSLDEYGFNRNAFKIGNTTKELSSPIEHALFHFPYYIEQFGAPSGLSCGFTESEDINAMMRSFFSDSANFDDFGDLLARNDRLAKLEAQRQLFVELNYLDLPTSFTVFGDGDSASDKTDNYSAIYDEVPLEVDVTFVTNPEVQYTGRLFELAKFTPSALFPHHIRTFMYNVLVPIAANDDVPRKVPESFFSLRYFNENATFEVYHSAKALFSAHSDSSGANGMRSEIIWSTPDWKNNGPRRDCVFVSADPEEANLCDSPIARVYMFFTMSFLKERYDCALVHWYKKAKEEPEITTGMFEVQPDFLLDGQRNLSVIRVYRSSFTRASLVLDVAEKNIDTSTSHS